MASSSAAYRDGSLGELEEDATALLNECLSSFIAMESEFLDSKQLANPAAIAAGTAAISLATQALGTDDVERKLELTLAAGYSASFFGLPRNDLMFTANRAMDLFAFPTSQRGAYHAAATALLQSYVISMKKGNAMSGLGILMAQNGAYRDGSLGITAAEAAAGARWTPGYEAARAAAAGARRNPTTAATAAAGARLRFPWSMRGTQADAYEDGSLGILMHQNGAYQDGSLGHIMRQNVAWRDGSLGFPVGAARRPVRYRRFDPSRPQALRGLGGGCGCSGVGADAAVVEETPFYKKPAYLAGGAVLLGVVLYAATRK